MMEILYANRKMQRFGNGEDRICTTDSKGGITSEI